MISLWNARYERLRDEPLLNVIAKSLVNHLPVGKAYGDEAICPLFRQGTGIQLPNDEIATAQISHQLKDSFSCASQ